MIEINTPLLRSLPQAVLERVLDVACERRFAAGEVMLNEGELRSELFIIQRGEATVVGKDWHGEPLVLARLSPGECFGELSMLSGEPASATVEAVTEAVVLAVPQSEFVSIAEEYPDLGRNLSALLAERLRVSNERQLRAQLGQLVAVVAPGDPRPAFRLAYHLALSIAKHACQPVALVDLSGLARELTGGPVRSYEEAVHDSHSHAPSRYVPPRERLHVVDASGGMPDGQLTSTLDRLREHARHVLVFAPGVPHRCADAVRRAGRVLLVTTEAEQPLLRAALADAPAPAAGECASVVLGEQPGIPSGRDARRAQAALGNGWACSIVPGGAGALDEPSLPEGSPAAWSVARLARSVAGLTVGLALGGGGAKGYAHIGVVRALERLGVPFDCVAGCSIGAPLAAGVAAGWSLDAIRGGVDSISEKARRPNVPLVSVLTSRGIRSELRDLTQNARFEDLRTPLAVVAVDIETGEEVLFRSGVVWPAMVASMAFPGIYEPVRIGRHLLVDGGVLNPVPVSSCVALGADLVISSNLSARHHEGQPSPSPNGTMRRRFLVENIARSLEIMQRKIVEQSCNHADVAIEPIFTPPPGLLDFKRGRELEQPGEEAVARALPRLREVLPWLS